MCFIIFHFVLFCLNWAKITLRSFSFSRLNYNLKESKWWRKIYSMVEGMVWNGKRNVWSDFNLKNCLCLVNDIQFLDIFLNIFLVLFLYYFYLWVAIMKVTSRNFIALGYIDMLSFSSRYCVFQFWHFHLVLFCSFSFCAENIAFIGRVSPLPYL